MFKHLVVYYLVSTLWSVVSGQEELPTKYAATKRIARRGQFPYVVGLKYERSEVRFVGALISNRFVLTVAERIVKNNILHVYLGAYHFNELEEPGRVNLVVNSSSDILLHSEYESNPNIVNNLAIMRLPEAVVFSELIRPIALPTSINDTELFDNELVFVAGWGTQLPIYSPAKTLHFINVTVEPFDKCKNETLLAPQQLCLDSSSERTICEGDEGTPIAAIRYGQPLLIGLANSPERCFPVQPQIGLRISYYTEWIDNTINNFDEMINETK